MDLRQARDLLGSRLLTRDASPLVTKTTATKAAAMQEHGKDQLSAEELAFLAADETQELAKLYLNDELACVGTHWLPGMKQKWDESL